MRYPFYGQDLFRRTEAKRKGAQMAKQHLEFGKAPKKIDDDAVLWGKLATTFAANLTAETERLVPRTAPAYGWLQGLVALSRAVAATAAEFEDED